MITFDCPHCGYRLQVDEQFAGRDGWCRICKKLIAVPSSDAKKPEDLTPTEQYARLTKAFQYAATKADRYQALFVKLREESQQWAAHADDTRRLAGQVQTLEKRLADVELALVQWSESSTPLPLSREAQHPADDLGDPVRRLAGERDEGRVADEALLPRVQQTETQYAARVDATAALASVQEAIARLEERWAGTTTRVDDLGAHMQAFEDLRGTVTRLDERVGAAGAEVGNLLPRMEAMESVTDQFEVLIREVENVKSALAELGARFDAERDARKEVEETVDQTRALVEAFRASVQDVISKLERLRSAAAQIVVETAGSPPSHETRPPSEGEPEVVVLSELAEEEPQVDSQAMLGTFLRFMGPSQENTC